MASVGRRARGVVLALVTFALRWADAQQAAPSADRRASSAAGEELTISVLTMGQGGALWERFGHNALRIRDARLGTDVAYNWGTFDFAQPNFLGRFLTGNTLYWLDTDPAPAMIHFYERDLDRTVVEQVLALSPAQRARLRDLVTRNALPEHREYRYDYFADNCSTRLRDAIDAALGGALAAQLKATPSAVTYRSESLRLMSGMPLAQAGMHVALGEPADARLTAWEESFVPMRLRDRLRAVRVAGPDDVLRPLVAEERVLHASRRPAESTGRPALYGRFLTLGLLLAGLVVLAVRRRAWAGLAALGVVWGLLAGVMGVILALAWGTTRHVFWYANENLLQLNPLALALTALVPLAAYRPRWRRRAFLVAGALAALSLLGLMLKALPAFEQRNLAIVLLALPVHLALAWALRPGAIARE